jgi:hypothetical protein
MPLVLPALLADAALRVGGISSVLEVDSTGSGQSGLQCCRPSLVGFGQPPHLVRCQSKISQCRPERLTSVDRIQELLPHLYREPGLRPYSPVGPSSVVLRLPALRTAATVGPPCSCPVRRLRPRPRSGGVADLAKLLRCPWRLSKQAAINPGTYGEACDATYCGRPASRRDQLLSLAHRGTLAASVQGG